MLGLAVFGGPHILGPGPQQSYPIGGGVNPADLLYEEAVEPNEADLAMFQLEGLVVDY